MLLDLIARALEAPLEVGRGGRFAPLDATGGVAPRLAGGAGGVPTPRLVAPLLDAIVVLGARLGPGGEVTPVLAERIAAAAALWRAGGGRLVVASGGATHGAPRAEAHAIAEGLRAAGVPDAVLLVEDRSRTTAENARETAAVLAPTGARAVWLVTQPFHARRAALLFRRAGLDAHPWHLADSLQYRDRGRALRWLIREYAAWVKLAVRGGR